MLYTLCLYLSLSLSLSQIHTHTHSHPISNPLHRISTRFFTKAYEAERQKHTLGLSAPDTATTSRPSIEPAQQMEEYDDDDEQEPSLFDILDDNVEEDPEDDVLEDQQA